MKTVGLPGVIQKNNRLFTKNLESSKGIIVYNETLKTIDKVEYRTWNPYRSKLAAALHKQVKHISLTEDATVLYLGAATGTTVSHLSDIVSKGVIYAVESSALAMQQLLKVVEHRKNIIPLLASARHPDRYQPIVPLVDCVYQDISQRDQAEMFLSNVDRYLKPQGLGVLMVKARSIDVAQSPKHVFTSVESRLIKHGITIKDQKSLHPYEKDHAVFVVTH